MSASTALAVIDGAQGPLAIQQPRVGLLRPIAKPAEVLQAQEELRSMIAGALVEGRDYGVIPGTERKDKKGNDISKRTLLKPGAERLNAAFGLTAEFTVTEAEVNHSAELPYVKRQKVWRNAHKGDKEFTWKEEQGTSVGLYRYVVKCALIHRESGAVVGNGVGACSSLESKYIDRPRDSENTVLKMAKKRAFVDATLTALGLSDQFTQDVEDIQANERAARGDSDPADRWNRPAPAEPEPPLTLELALAMTLGAEGDFNGQGGKPLSGCSPRLLSGAAAWIDKDDDRKARYERLRSAIQIVLTHREGEARAALAKADAEAEQRAKPVTGAAEEMPAGLDSPDDDGLPF